MSDVRLGLYSKYIYSFPTGLMNSSLSANILGNKFARYIENMMPAKNMLSVGTKRYGVVKKAIINIENIVIIKIIEFINEKKQLEILLILNNGYIIKYDELNKTYSILYKNINIDKSINTTVFNGKLIIVDGVNTPICYDGKNIKKISDLINIEYEQINFIKDNQIDILLFYKDQNLSFSDQIVIELKNGNKFFYDIDEKKINGLNYILSLPDKIAFDITHISNIYCRVYPPILSNIYTMHDRLWGVNNQINNQAMYVYYTQYPNNIYSWHNITTKSINYINMADKHNDFDEFIKILSINNHMLFFGKKKIQIWGGNNPSDINNFYWIKTIPIGLVHQNLILELENNILFVSKYGLKSISSSFMKDDYHIKDEVGENIHSNIIKDVNYILNDNNQYKKATSWIYPEEGIYGFKINKDSLIYFSSNISSGWVIWSGIFSDFDNICTFSDGRLFLAKNNLLYVYANGKEQNIKNSIYFNDDNKPIRTIWWSGNFNFDNRWANKYWKLLLDNNSYKDTNTRIKFTRITNSNNSKNFYIDTNNTRSLWNESYWNLNYWKNQSKLGVLRDKFMNNNISFTIETNSNNSTFNILGVESVGI